MQELNTSSPSTGLHLGKNITDGDITVGASKTTGRIDIGNENMSGSITVGHESSTTSIRVVSGNQVTLTGSNITTNGTMNAAGLLFANGGIRCNSINGSNDSAVIGIGSTLTSGDVALGNDTTMIGDINMKTNGGITIGPNTGVGEITIGSLNNMSNINLGTKGAINIAGASTASEIKIGNAVLAGNILLGDNAMSGEVRIRGRAMIPTLQGDGTTAILRDAFTPIGTATTDTRFTKMGQSVHVVVKFSKGVFSGTGHMNIFIPGFTFAFESDLRVEYVGTLGTTVAFRRLFGRTVTGGDYINLYGVKTVDGSTSPIIADILANVDVIISGWVMTTT